MTDKTAFLENLRKAHDFPVMYTFKVIAWNRPDFVDHALAVVRAVFPEVSPAVSRRESAGGKHLSLTLEMPVPDAESVAVLYERFNALPGVHMLL